MAIVQSEDFNKINEAVIAFMIAISDVNNIAIPKINTVNTAQLLTVSSGKLKVQTATNPYMEPISLLIK